MKMQYAPSGNENEYEVFVDEKGEKRRYATFWLFDVPRSGDRSYCKQINVDVKVNRSVADEIFNAQNLALFLKIYRFVFDAGLEITYKKKQFKVCKMHSKDYWMALIYREFARGLKKEGYKVKMYRNWVEIEKPS